MRIFARRALRLLEIPVRICERTLLAICALLSDAQMGLVEAILLLYCAARGALLLLPHATFDDAPVLYSYLMRIMPESAWGALYMTLSIVHFLMWRRGSERGRCTVCGAWMLLSGFVSCYMLVASPYLPAWQSYGKDAMLAAVCHLALWLKLRNKKELERVVDCTGADICHVTALSRVMLHRGLIKHR
jgi:hypothetical protein